MISHVKTLYDLKRYFKRYRRARFHGLVRGWPFGSQVVSSVTLHVCYLTVTFVTMRLKVWSAKFVERYNLSTSTIRGKQTRNAGP